MKIIYNIEDFAIKEIFNPYKFSFDFRLWQAEYDDTLTFEEKVAVMKLYHIYLKRIKQNLNWIISAVDSRPSWKKEIFNRLKNTKFKFYKWLNSPFIDWVNENIKKEKQNDKHNN